MQVHSSAGPANDQPVPVGEAEGVSKTFGETRALIDVSLNVLSGECHGLVGRNGAGKSTLVTLLTGLARPDRGTIRLSAQAAPSLADRGAWLAKVACVYQKSMVVPPLTVAENVFLNRPTNGERSPVVNWRRMRERAHDVMLEWGFDIDVDQEAGRLTVEQRQIVEIARALSIGARFLILDEPTASLEKAAVERLFDRVRRLREGGVGILYISHHLEEIYEICDRVSVLRDGELVLSGQVAKVSQENLVAAMIGNAPPRSASEIDAVDEVGALGERRLQVSHLSVRSRSGSVDDVSLEVRAGECLGLLGLEGSGSSTVADAVVGLIKPAAGTISINGKVVPPGKVDAVLRLGVGYVPQDRHARGFAPQLGVGENITLSVLDRISRNVLGVVSSEARDRIAEEQASKLQIVARSLDQPVASLSGGNQQKVVVGRALAPNPSVLVVVNPTVGVDVASKEALLDAVGQARTAGMAVLLVSDDFEDLRICTRLQVMVRGKTAGEFERPPWDRQRLIAAVEGLQPAGVDQG
ncbi:MAG TPA: sugar ABC transporter ATP-binding protein [Candidatus Dormibacteraeota bacterium]|nr:sugar ABC transporter ATP-binding protein [Candidatus Dormibacteraeota bacterium]